MSYRLVIFDFDGTLADSFPYVVGLYDALAARYGLKPVAPEQIDELRGFDARQMMDYFRVPFWRIPLIARDVRGRMARDIHQIGLFSGIDQVLRGLVERGIQLAVVSSNSTGNIRRVLGDENAGLIRHYEGGVSIFGKPPKLRKVMHRSGVGPDETLLIGDEIRDIQAARQVEIDCGVVGWGYTRLDALEAHAPEIVFHRVGEILDKID